MFQTPRSTLVKLKRFRVPCPSLGRTGFLHWPHANHAAPSRRKRWKRKKQQQAPSSAKRSQAGPAGLRLPDKAGTLVRLRLLSMLILRLQPACLPARSARLQHAALIFSSRPRWPAGRRTGFEGSPFFPRAGYIRTARWWRWRSWLTLRRRGVSPRAHAPPGSTAQGCTGSQSASPRARWHHGGTAPNPNPRGGDGAGFLHPPRLASGGYRQTSIFRNPLAGYCRG